MHLDGSMFCFSGAGEAADGTISLFFAHLLVEDKWGKTERTTDSSPGYSLTVQPQLHFDFLVCLISILTNNLSRFYESVVGTVANQEFHISQYIGDLYPFCPPLMHHLHLTSPSPHLRGRVFVDVGFSELRFPWDWLSIKWCGQHRNDLFHGFSICEVFLFC